MSRSLSSPTDSFRHWQLAASDICGNLTFHFGERGTCFGQIRREYIGELEMAHIRCQVAAIRRAKGNSDHGQDRHCFLILQRAGSTTIRDDHHGYRIKPGEVALVDSAQPFEMAPEGPINHLSIHLDRQALLRALPGGRVSFGKVGLESGCGRLLKALVGQIGSGALPLNALAADGVALQSSLIELLGIALSGAPVVKGTASSMGDITRLALRAQVEDLIALHLQEQALTPAFLATAMQMSVRQLYRLFQNEGEGLHAHILNRRLQACAKEIARSQRTITTICFDWGFSDSAHFSRVFKQRYGLSPRDYRLAQREVAAACA